jgi:hypothetical protein
MELDNCAKNYFIHPKSTFDLKIPNEGFAFTQLYAWISFVNIIFLSVLKQPISDFLER